MKNYEVDIRRWHKMLVLRALNDGGVWTSAPRESRRLWTVEETSIEGVSHHQGNTQKETGCSEKGSN